MRWRRLSGCVLCRSRHGANTVVSCCLVLRSLNVVRTMCRVYNPAKAARCTPLPTDSRFPASDDAVWTHSSGVHRSARRRRMCCDRRAAAAHGCFASLSIRDFKPSVCAAMPVDERVSHAGMTDGGPVTSAKGLVLWGWDGEGIPCQSVWHENVDAALLLRRC